MGVRWAEWDNYYSLICKQQFFWSCIWVNFSSTTSQKHRLIQCKMYLLMIRGSFFWLHNAIVFGFFCKLFSKIFRAVFHLCFVHPIFSSLVIWSLLLCDFLSWFFPHCPSCFAKCKQRLCNIFLTLYTCYVL